MNTNVIFRIILLIAFFTSCTDTKVDETIKRSYPNIVFIFADDLGYGDLGCFGATDINTPNINAMANEGVKFTDFYSASPVCSPSRAGLLTGRLPQRMGINGVFFPDSYTGMPESEVTIAELLKTKGYTSGVVGKWHLGHREKYLPLQQGFDSYFGIPYSNDMSSVVYMRDNEVETTKVDQHYTTQTYTKEAIGFIEKNKENPFYLYVAHSMPHVPLYASSSFEGKSNRGLYGDVVEEIDWSVGQIIKALKTSDLLENTLIVFSSDNGPWLVMKDHGGSAGELREGKQYTFDGGMRVPTVAMWKGKIKPNTVVVEMASQMDWFPTFANMVDAKIPEDREIDGKDISGVLFNNGKRASNDYLFLDGEKLEAYRKGDWKVKLPYKGYSGSRWKSAVAKHDTLLFNIKQDPGEKNNLYITHKELAKTLIEEMHAKYKALGELPPSLFLTRDADKGHFIYLNSSEK